MAQLQEYQAGLECELQDGTHLHVNEGFTTRDAMYRSGNTGTQTIKGFEIAGCINQRKIYTAENWENISWGEYVTAFKIGSYSEKIIEYFITERHWWTKVEISAHGQFERYEHRKRLLKKTNWVAVSGNQYSAAKVASNQ